MKKYFLLIGGIALFNAVIGQYCTPVPTFGTNEGDYINDVMLGLINNTNTGVQGGPSYNDFTSMSTTLQQSSNYVFTVSGASNSGNDASFAVWIDYNQDNDFSGPGEKLGEITTSTSSLPQTISFTVPSSAIVGTTRLRVRLVRGDTLLNACTDYSYGETEDYAVVIDTLSCTSLAMSVSSADPSCGDTDGWAAVSVSGGVSPYLYNWSDGQSTDTAFGLGAGDFFLTVTDSTGCWEDTSVTLIYLGGPAISVTETSPSCNTGFDGSAVVSVITGDFPFTYQWSTGDNSYQITGLDSGTYYVTVTDSSGCFTTDSAMLDDPDPITLAATVTHPSTCGANDGQVTVTVSGGVLPYTYEWDDDSLQTTSTATGLSTGVYTVFVSDTNSCSADTTLELVGQGTGPFISAIGFPVSCNSGSDGSAIVSVIIGSSPPYIYEWNTGGTSTTETGLIAGIYDVTVTDSLGCQSIDTAYVLEPDEPLIANVTMTNTNTMSCDGSASADVQGGIPPYSYQWNDPDGQTTQTATGLCP
ncbi:SprB repeat-containing protein, partial [Bacteroidales bacterium AH-315-I05]|nr:SprB repeat-containing protein [Bacteroidales bacterium AH-315-I05]